MRRIAAPRRARMRPAHTTSVEAIAINSQKMKSVMSHPRKRADGAPA